MTQFRRTPFITAHKIASIIFCISLTMITGCASMISENSYDISITSEPTQTEFRVINKAGDTVSNGKTPAVVHLNAYRGFFKRADYTVVFEKEGYDTLSEPLKATLSPGYYGNILLYAFGIAGALIFDPFTGAMFQLPGAVSTNLPLRKETTGSHE